MSDVTEKDIRRAACKRASEMFIEESKKSVKAKEVKVVSSASDTRIDGDPVYAMLPAWFITFEYKNKPHTMLVNGDTGKVVGALPWNKALFISLTILMGTVFSTAAYFLAYSFFTLQGSSSREDVRVIALVISGAIAAFSYGIKKISKVMKNIALTQSSQTLNFVKKRQG